MYKHPVNADTYKLLNSGLIDCGLEDTPTYDEFLTFFEAALDGSISPHKYYTGVEHYLSLIHKVKSYNKFAK